MFFVLVIFGYGCRVLVNVFLDVLRFCVVCLNMCDFVICVFGIREVVWVFGEVFIIVFVGFVLFVFVVVLSEGF